MPSDRLRRYSFRRSSRPRNWNPYLGSGSALASHRTPKTGGYRSVRASIHEMRVRELAELPGNADNEESIES